MISFKRSCPKCDRDIDYQTERSLCRANQNQTVCPSCTTKGKKLSEGHKKKIGDSLRGKYTGSKNHMFRNGHSKETKKKISQSVSGENNYWFGRKISESHRENLVKSHLGHRPSDSTRQKMSEARIGRPLPKKVREKIKSSLHKSDTRKKHLDGLHRSKWLKVRTDKGQLELIEKWDRLGFHFEPNFQIKTETDLFYVDGYDKEKNIVLEYDSKYHHRPIQRKKDLDRQNIIIGILKPKKFWRYDAMNKTWRNIAC